MVDSLDHYLERHPEFVDPLASGGVTLLTTGDAGPVDDTARVFWPDAPAFVSARAAVVL